MNGDAAIATDKIVFLPPLVRPGKIVCVGLNHADHTKESPYEQPSYPTLFPRFVNSLVAHDQPIIRPLISDSLDFEGELAVVMASGGRHIAPADALGHVFGHSIFNDGSVREYQFKSPQWTLGKNFDKTGAFGPWVVTADELPAGAKGLKLETRLNGEVVQSANTSDMLYDVATLISVISEAITLEAGDLIVAGTPAGHRLGARAQAAHAPWQRLRSDDRRHRPTRQPHRRRTRIGPAEGLNPPSRLAWQETPACAPSTSLSSSSAPAPRA